MGNSKMIPSTFSSNHPIPQNRHPNELAHYRHNVLLEGFSCKGVSESVTLVVPFDF